jgi:hypothetical protein
MQHWDIYRRALDYWSTLQMRVIARVIITMIVIVIVLALPGF